MEKNTISIHEMKVWRGLQESPEEWVTSREVKATVVGVSIRTVRHHIKRFVELGLLDKMELFPEHRFRIAGKADKRNTAYLQRLERAIEASNLTPGEQGKAEQEHTTFVIKHGSQPEKRVEPQKFSIRVAET